MVWGAIKKNFFALSKKFNQKQNISIEKSKLNQEKLRKLLFLVEWGLAEISADNIVFDGPPREYV